MNLKGGVRTVLNPVSPIKGDEAGHVVCAGSRINGLSDSVRHGASPDLP